MMKHFILFLFFLFSACSSFRDSAPPLELTPEEDLSENLENNVEKDEDSSDSSLPSSVGESNVSNENIDIDEDEEGEIIYIDEEDEDLIVEKEGEINIEEDLSDPIEQSAEGSEDNPSEELTDSMADTVDSSSTESFLPPSSVEQTKASHLKTSQKKSSSPVKKTWIPLKKIKVQTYRKGNFLVNAVYIARIEDRISSVSHKIFGSDQTSQLYTINPHLKNRDLKVGDKIYYQSPLRPQDTDKILFYFEDKGVDPTMYDIEPGQNIRTLSTQLLGDVNSWKEIWATNPELVSKGIVDQKMTIKYWLPEDEVASVPQVPLSDDSKSSSELAEEVQPEGLEDSLSDDSAPPLIEGEVADSSPEEDLSPPSLPPPLTEENLKEKEKETLFSNFPMEKLLLIIVAIGILLFAFFRIWKKRKKVEYDFSVANFEVEEDQ